MTGRLLEILTELHDHGVDFVIVGGVAVALHGGFRVTFDLDIVPSLAPHFLADRRRSAPAGRFPDQTASPSNSVLRVQIIICGHNVKGWWSWSYSPLTGMLYVPINRSCLNQTTNERSVSGASPRFTQPEPGFEVDGHLTEVRAIDISTGREAWRYTQRAPNAGSTLATAGNVVFHGDLNRRYRAFDAETGDVLWETILGSQITGFPVTYTAGGRQYLTVPVGGASIFQMNNYASELEAPMGSNMIVTFALPEE